MTSGGQRARFRSGPARASREIQGAGRGWVAFCQHAHVQGDKRHLHDPQRRPDLRPVDNGAVNARPGQTSQHAAPTLGTPPVCRRLGNLGETGRLGPRPLAYGRGRDLLTHPATISRSFGRTRSQRARRETDTQEAEARVRRTAPCPSGAGSPNALGCSGYRRAELDVGDHRPRRRAAREGHGDGCQQQHRRHGDGVATRLLYR